MNNARGLQSKTEGVFALNMIVVIEAFIRNAVYDCPPCQPCQPCSRTSAQMNSQIQAKASITRVAIVTDKSFIKYIFKKAFPGEMYPIHDAYDPRIIAITDAVNKMKNES